MTTAEHTLARLRAEYPDWHIWRSRNGRRPAGWVATNRAPNSDRDPTLHGATSAELERQLADPPQRCGQPFPAMGSNR